MRSTLSLLCAILFTLFSDNLLAQNKIELSNELEQIGAFKQLNKTFDLKAGEDIILTATPMRGIISKIEVEMPGTEFKLSAKKVRNIDRQRIPVTKSGTYTFKFYNNGIGKKEVNIKIYKTRRTVDKDTVYLDDIIFTAFRDTIKKYKDDTIPVPDVASYEFKLSPSFRYGGESDSVIREPLIDGNKYEYAAYWIGVGAQSIRAYDELKQNPPPSWLIAGVNEPLMAYGLGITKTLPISSSSLARDVMFKFMNPELENVPKLTRRDNRANFYDIIPVASASKYDELVLAVRNFNTTSSVPIYIKIVKFNLDRKYYNEYIIRERVQEIFKEKKVEVWAPEDE